MEAAGEPAGRFYVERGENRIRVIDVAVAAGHRGQGIGTLLLSDLIAEASAAAKVVELHVEFNNPAQRLYRRLGFEVAEERPPYFRLERRPGGGQPNTTS